MQVAFANRRLQRNYENFARASRDWGDTIARVYIRRVDLLSEIDEFHLLYTIRSIGLHRLSGQRSGQFAITLNRRWRLILSYIENENKVIVEEVTNHYGD